MRATEIHDQMADRALRVIAISVKKYAEKPTDLSEEALETDQEFRGMVGMIDPPRPESKDAVARAKLAGIKTVMITGDHKATAAAIAKEIGIMEAGDVAVTGAELNEMDETELISRVRGISVYARVSPEDKMRIVRAWSAHNAVIAMTGDGVNDAPALKAADVGVAMGITGTEVSKNAADMVITDDNFATIVDAISEGRTSYDNIRKTIQFLLGVNFAEIFVLLFGMLAFGLSTVTALQILIVNVVYDGIPGFFLAYEKPEPGVMKRKPLPKGTGVFANRVGMFIGIRAVTFSILIMSAFVIGLSYGGSGLFGHGSGSDAHRIAMTMAFMVLSFASVIDLFNTRTSLSIFKAGITTNRGAFWCVIGAIVFATFVALFNPIGQIFDVAPTFGDGALMTGTLWLIIVGLSLLQIVAVEIVKWVLRVRDRKNGLAV
jgi:magnesium-transporting ATPase (P-type)